VKPLLTLRNTARLAIVPALFLAACGVTHPVGVDWKEVSEKTTCEALNPAACVGAAGFTVRTDGTWVAGPAASGARKDGALTATEKAQITSDVSVLETQRGQQCDATGNVPGTSDFVEVTLTDNTVLRAFEKGTIPNQTCYRGGQEAASQLHDDVSALMVKYYPGGLV
jgi:hypothetical protein